MRYAPMLARFGRSLTIHNLFFLILGTNMIYSFFSSLPFVKGMPKRVQIIFFCIAKFISVLVLSKAFGYVFMDELQQAVSQFLPSTSGGMPGASTPPPLPSGPSSSGWTPILASDSSGEQESPPSDPSLKTTLSPQRATSAHVHSALEEREEELLLENLQKRKGALGEGETLEEVRDAVEKNFHVETTGDKFKLIQEMEKEKTGAQKEDCPVTNSTFNEVRDYESHTQDGRGGARPTDLSEVNSKSSFSEYSTGIRDPPGRVF